jgi:hypothetical protein
VVADVADPPLLELPLLEPPLLGLPLLEAPPLELPLLEAPPLLPLREPPVAVAPSG